MSSQVAALAEIAELRGEAEEARGLASMFTEPDAIADLLSYARALELDANRSEEALHHPDDILLMEKFRAWALPRLFFAGSSH